MVFVNPERFRTALLAALFCTCACIAAVQPYPQYPGEPASTLFSATVDGQAVFVHSTADFNAGADYTRFAFTGSVTVTVNLISGTVTGTPSISPRAYKIALTRTGNSVTFTLDQPRKLVLYMGTSKLIIFAEAPEVNPPKLGDANVKNIMDYGVDATGATIQTAKINDAITELSGLGGKKVLYFPRGVYFTGAILMKSNVTLYLAPDALITFSTNAADYARIPVLGWGNGAIVYFGQTRNAGIVGRGTLNGRGYTRYFSNMGRDIHSLLFHSCRNTVMDGVVVLDARTWTWHPVDCDTISAINVKIINSISFAWNDGFDTDVSRDVLVDDCFYWGNDDCTCIKGCPGVPSKPNERILYRNCVLWTYSANGLRFGYSTGGDESQWSYAKNIEFRDIHFLAATHGIHMDPGVHSADSLRFINCYFEAPPTAPLTGVIIFINSGTGLKNELFDHTTSYFLISQMQAHQGTTSFTCTVLNGKEITSLAQAQPNFLTNLDNGAQVTFAPCQPTAVVPEPDRRAPALPLFSLRGKTARMQLAANQRFYRLTALDGSTIAAHMLHGVDGTVDFSSVPHGTYVVTVGDSKLERDRTLKIVIP